MIGGAAASGPPPVGAASGAGPGSDPQPADAAIAVRRSADPTIGVASIASRRTQHVPCCRSLRENPGILGGLGRRGCASMCQRGPACVPARLDASAPRRVALCLSMTRPLRPTCSRCSQRTRCSRDRVMAARWKLPMSKNGHQEVVPARRFLNVWTSIGWATVSRESRSQSTVRSLTCRRTFVSAWLWPHVIGIGRRKSSSRTKSCSSAAGTAALRRSSIPIASQRWRTSTVTAS